MSCACRGGSSEACGCPTCSSAIEAVSAFSTSERTRDPRGLRLAQRLAPIVDRLRQRNTDYGLRAYEVFLVWTRWSGRERGEGDERELRRVPILPRPLVEDLTSLSLSPFAAGILPVGSVRVSQITTTLTADNLRGLQIPGRAYFDRCGLSAYGASETPEEASLTVAGEIGANLPEYPDRVPEPFEFFYEIVEDASHAQRPKFRLLSVPFRRPGRFDWTLVLERVSEDRDREGRS